MLRAQQAIARKQTVSRIAAILILDQSPCPGPCPPVRSSVRPLLYALGSRRLSPSYHLRVILANVRRINVLGGLYVTAEQRPLTGAATQPKRLAVLALLVVAGERGMNREQILNYLWPDNEEERGRHALTQALYALRHDLEADEVFLGQQELRLNPDLITSDYAEFHAAVRSDAPERAVACYGGPFLKGFHLTRADNFEHWSEEQRTSLAHEFGRMLEAAARSARERGDFQAAVGFLKQRAAQDPLNGKVAAKLMEALATQGAVVEALQHARVHEVMVQQELGLAPDPELTALAARLRAAPRALQADSPPSVAQGTQSEVAEAPARRRWGAPATFMLLVLATLAAAVAVARRNAVSLAENGRPVIAVGQIADYSGKQPGGLGRPLADMLATNLARGSGFRVISNTRMLELMRQLRGAGDSDEVVSAAARQAGAAELIDGALYAIAPDRYRLDLRRVDLATGAVLRAYRVEGVDLYALVDSGTPSLVSDLGGAAPTGSLAEVSTGSVRAYQAYDDGLRYYYEGDLATAERRFKEALELDPTFAQAAYYYSRATTSGSRTETMARLRRAVDLSRHAGDRDRLVIQALWAANNSSPALAAIADTLTIRYPEEVEGYYFVGAAASLLGNYLKAVPALRRALELDSLGFKIQPGQRCRVCEAYDGLAYVYAAVDSQAEAFATIREWVRRQPSIAQPWLGMAGVYSMENQPDSAMRALRIADSLDPRSPAVRRFLIPILANLEDYPEVERLLRSELGATTEAFHGQTVWDLAVILRQMGRLKEALPLARRFRMGIQERLLPGAAPYNALLEGQVRFEQEDYRGAAALFDSIAVGERIESELSLRSRDRIWAWVHEADAVAKLGDTTRLRFLADSMEILGRGVAHARDRVLHAHVRGLLASIKGRDEEAAKWFRMAIVSPVIGFTRSNYELAGAYLRTHRPTAAVAILRSATRGGTDGSTLYITRTDLEARLAQAFDSAGQADSAVFYYRRVLRTWERADDQFRPRRDSIELAMRRLEPLPHPQPPH